MDLIGATNQRRHAKKSDIFCWSCCLREPTLFCLTCERSFHTSPVCSYSKKLTAAEIQRWRCMECQAVDEDKMQLREKNIDAACVKKLLTFLLESFQKDSDITEHFDDVDYSSAIAEVVHPLDLNKIGEKMNAGQYSCPKAFWLDIKRISFLTKLYRKDDIEAVKATEKLKFVQNDDNYVIRLCYECFLNANHDSSKWTTMVCAQPHRLVWAKMQSWPYWPAKLMSVDQHKNTAEVIFFSGERAILEPSDCLMFSRRNPSYDIPEHKAMLRCDEQKENLQIDMKKASTYIMNIEKRFNTVFIYATDCTPLDAQNLERHLYDSIPGAWKSLGKLEIPPPIVKRKPAPASIKYRRHTMAPKKVSKQVSPSAGVAPASRITRRSSTFHEMRSGRGNHDSMAPKKVSNQISLSSAVTPSCRIRRRSSTFHEQRVQSDSSGGNSSSSENSSMDHVKVNKLKTSPLKSPAKRKWYSDEDEVIQILAKKNVPGSSYNSPLQSSSNSVLLHSNGTAFKVPTVPKPRMIFKNPPSNESLQSNDTKPTDLMVIANEIVQKNVRELVGCLETNMNSALLQFREAIKPTALEIQAQQLDDKLSQALKQLEVTQKAYHSEKMKNAQLNDELSKALNRNDEYSVEWVQLMGQNRILSTDLQNTEEMCEQLRNENAILKQSVAEAKKRKWCASCGKAGGRFYCTTQCEDNYHGQSKRP